MQTARIVSLEGVTLVERHTGALFGSVQELQEEMQKVVGGVETPQVHLPTYLPVFTFQNIPMER